MIVTFGLRPRATLLAILAAALLASAVGCSSDPGEGPDATATATAEPPPATATASAEPPPPAVSPPATAEQDVHSSVVVVIPEAATSASGSPRPLATAAPSDGPYVPLESIDTEDKRLNVTVGGETVFIRNGGRVELGDDLAVEIYLDPYPPTTLHSVVDLYLTRGGEPVTDASIDVEFDMLAMAHGPFVATAKKIGAGHHLVTLDYIMFGAWDQFVTIREGLKRVRFPVVIVAYP